MISFVIFFLTLGYLRLLFNNFHILGFSGYCQFQIKLHCVQRIYTLIFQSFETYCAHCVLVTVTYSLEMNVYSAIVRFKYQFDQVG